MVYKNCFKNTVSFFKENKLVLMFPIIQVMVFYLQYIISKSYIMATRRVFDFIPILKNFFLALSVEDFDKILVASIKNSPNLDVLAINFIIALFVSVAFVFLLLGYYKKYKSKDSLKTIFKSKFLKFILLLIILGIVNSIPNLVNIIIILFKSQNIVNLLIYLVSIFASIYFTYTLALSPLIIFSKDMKIRETISNSFKASNRGWKTLIPLYLVLILISWLSVFLITKIDLIIRKLLGFQNLWVVYLIMISIVSTLISYFGYIFILNWYESQKN